MINKNKLVKKLKRIWNTNRSASIVGAGVSQSV
jgi:hypothetical protein